MSNLTEKDQWEAGIYQLETSDPVLGGPNGVSNKPAKQLANRTLWLKKQQEKANEALKAHERSRNHPDGTTAAKGFVQLSDNPNLDSNTLAATPKAVKAVNDAAAKKAANLADLTDKPKARQNLGLKSAALRDVGTTKGQVMEVGAGGLLMGARHRDDVYTNDGQIFRANAGSTNKPPMNTTAGIISLPADGGPSTGYVAISPASGAAWIGSSNKPENGVRWSRIYTTDNKPSAADVNAYSKTESDNRFLQKSGGTVTGKTQFNAGIDFANPNTGIANGTDAAGYNGANLLLKSWNGIGFYKTIGEKGITGFIDVRTGDLRMKRNITADGQVIEAGKRVYSPNNKPSATDVDAVSATEGGEFKKEIRASGGVKIQVPGRNDNGGGVYPGNGDGASYAACNVDIKSWHGIGFYNTCDTVGIKGRSLFIDVRQGNLEAQGIIKGKTVSDASGRVYSPGNKPKPGDINAYSKSESDGRYFARGTTATTKDVAWNAASGVYNTHEDGMTMVVHFSAGGTGSTRAADFRFNYGNGGLAFRSSRDDKGYENDWTKVYTDRQRPTAAEVGALPNIGGKLSGEIQSTSPDNYRIVGGDYGTFWRNDGKNLYLMLTNAKDQYGTWNTLRPVTVDVKTGFVTLGHGQRINGNLSVGDDLYIDGKGFIGKSGLNSYKNESGDHHQTNGLKLQGAGNLLAEIYHHEHVGKYHELAIHVANGGGDGWFSFRPDGSLSLNGPNPVLNVGNAKVSSDGNIFGSRWGNKWLWDAVVEQDNGRVDWATYNRDVGARATNDYVNGTFIKRIRLGPEERIGADGAKEYHGPKVLAGFYNNDWDSTTEVMYWRPIQYLIGNNWIDVGFD